MIKVIGVRFRKAGKVYYFDPAQMEIKMGDHVIVETARGIEFGEVVLGVREVDEKKVIQPLKSVIRMATKNDEELERKSHDKVLRNVCQPDDQEQIEVSALYTSLKSSVHGHDDHHRNYHTAGNADDLSHHTAVWFHKEAKRKSFCNSGNQEPVAAECKDICDWKSQPCCTDSIKIQYTHMKSNIVDTHPEHHGKTHHHGIDKTFSLVLWHIFCPPVCRSFQKLLSASCHRFFLLFLYTGYRCRHKKVEVT